jgi:hypothetical protein
LSVHYVRASQNIDEKDGPASRRADGVHFEMEKKLEGDSGGGDACPPSPLVSTREGGKDKGTHAEIPVVSCRRGRGGLVSGIKWGGGHASYWSGRGEGGLEQMGGGGGGGAHVWSIGWKRGEWSVRGKVGSRGVGG